MYFKKPLEAKRSSKSNTPPPRPEFHRLQRNLTATFHFHFSPNQENPRGDTLVEIQRSSISTEVRSRWKFVLLYTIHRLRRNFVGRTPEYVIVVARKVTSLRIVTRRVTSLRTPPKKGTALVISFASYHF
ncbi:Hypothetical predicted protein [Olea europaea subsp. europaea]|uniref:Uncharacterized protein n=1 Tax=Olea europaea subsp. europaea TaxID=158383 RepID=A0A8S0R037_OLEEU|nr:Hypothetical predicted protein [Olea europaea subsp. europaea]